PTPSAVSEPLNSSASLQGPRSRTNRDGVRPGSVSNVTSCAAKQRENENLRMLVRRRPSPLEHCVRLPPAPFTVQRALARLSGSQTPGSTAHWLVPGILVSVNSFPSPAEITTEISCGA